MSQFCRIQEELGRVPDRPNEPSRQTGLEPLLLVGDVCVMELGVALGEVDDSFYEADDSHDDWSSKEKDRSDDRYEEHDDPCLRIAQNKLVNSEGPQQDSEYTCGYPFAIARRRRWWHLAHLTNSPIAAFAASIGLTSPTLVPSL